VPVDPLELAAIEMVRVRLPMRRSRAAAHGTMPVDRDVVLVRALGSDGAEGWGECSALESPTYSDEHTEGAWAVLRDSVAPAALAGGRNRGIGHPMASAAVDIAVTDLSLRRQGLTLAAALGRDGDDGLPLAWTGVVGMQSTVEDVLAEVDEALSRGATAVKLKICPGWDVEPVTAVHDAHPQLRVSVDANGSYGRDDADHLVELGRLLAVERGYLEQPLAAEDLSGLTRLAGRCPARVALDETVVSATDAGILGSLRNRGLINVKPARLGGVSSTLALSQLVASLKPKRRPETYLGGMFETGVGRSAALAIGQLTVTLPETDLGPSAWYFEEDVTDPVELDADGSHRAAVGPGLTRAPRPDRLAEVAVDRLTLDR
jgi:o-succinylbenzoate synthase